MTEGSKVVFVGNVPYNMAEGQLIDVFKSVGEVVGFRLVFDRDTGKPKGYGFCEFADHETAQSAVRNLDGTDVGGRPLRIDLADSDPFLEGKTTIRGELVDAGPSESWDDSFSFLGALPPGTKPRPGISAVQAIDEVIASMTELQVMDLLAQMKAYAITAPDQARALFQHQPQFSFALFQAMRKHGVGDPGIVNRILVETPGITPPPSLPSYPPIPPMPAYGIPPPDLIRPPVMQPQHTGNAWVPPPHPYFAAPPATSSPPSSQSSTTTPPSSQPDLNESQQDMLKQVLSLTEDQIDAMSVSEQERDAIRQLRAQFSGTHLPPSSQ